MNGPVVFFIVFIFFLYFPLNWQVLTTMSLCFTEEDRKPVRVCLLTLVLKLWLKRVKPNYTEYNIVIDTLTTSTYVWRVWFVCVCVCLTYGCTPSVGCWSSCGRCLSRYVPWCRVQRNPPSQPTKNQERKRRKRGRREVSEGGVHLD